MKTPPKPSPGRNGTSPKPKASSSHTPLSTSKIAFVVTDDDGDEVKSEASSDLSQHEGDNHANERIVKYTPSTHYTAYRLHEQKRTYETSLNAVMEFIDDYPINLDIIHAIQSAKQKRFTDQYEWLKDVMKRPEAKFALHMVKVIGIWRFTLHEMVVFENIEAIDRRIMYVVFLIYRRYDSLTTLSWHSLLTL